MEFRRGEREKKREQKGKEEDRLAVSQSECDFGNVFAIYTCESDITKMPTRVEIHRTRNKRHSVLHVNPFMK